MSPHLVQHIRYLSLSFTSTIYMDMAPLIFTLSSSPLLRLGLLFHSRTPRSWSDLPRSLQISLLYLVSASSHIQSLRIHGLQCMPFTPLKRIPDINLSSSSVAFMPTRQTQARDISLPRRIHIGHNWGGILSVFATYRPVQLECLLLDFQPWRNDQGISFLKEFIVSSLNIRQLRVICSCKFSIYPTPVKSSQLHFIVEKNRPVHTEQIELLMHAINACPHPECTRLYIRFTYQSHTYQRILNDVSLFLEHMQVLHTFCAIELHVGYGVLSYNEPILVEKIRALSSKSRIYLHYGAHV